MQATGIGTFYEAFEKLKNKLKKKGLFDSKRKKPLLMIAQKIGIITSLTGTTLKDILSIINRRFANIEILIASVKV